jgi:hypothetical protein
MAVKVARWIVALAISGLVMALVLAGAAKAPAPGPGVLMGMADAEETLAAGPAHG